MNAKPVPGLQGDYTDTCIGCLRPTDTGVAVQGPAEFHIAVLHAWGLPMAHATATVGRLAHQLHGSPAGTVPVIAMTLRYRVCASCAAKAAGMAPSLLVSGGAIRLYTPEQLRGRR